MKLILKSPGNARFNKAQFFMVIRELSGWSLTESKRIADLAPVVLFKGLDPDVAREYKRKLEATGAEVELDQG